MFLGEIGGVDFLSNRRKVRKRIRFSRRSFVRAGSWPPGPRSSRTRSKPEQRGPRESRAPSAERERKNI